MSNGPENLSRRKFLSGSAFALSSLGLPRPRGGEALEPRTPAGGVVHRTLGRTGLRVPIVNMGVMNADNPAVVQQSFEIGVRFFDTAMGYQGGRNEEMIGTVLKNLGVRDRAVIQTKIPFPRAGGPAGSLSPEEVRARMLADFDGCLKRLQTDYVDILMIHQPTVSQMNDPGVIQALTEAKKQGRARFVGLSTHADQANVVNDAARSEFYDVVVAAFNFTMANNAAMTAAIQAASSKKIGLIAMKTQASGRRGQNTGTVNQTAALKWVLHHQEITTAIPGYTNFEHMKEDFSVAYGLDYTEEEKKFLAEKNLIASIQFCAQCQDCLGTCSRGVDIPTLMRCHMYVKAYGNFEHARATLDSVGPDAHLRLCGDCGDCAARCVNCVDIPRNIRDLRAMYL